jgi:hypothetical protein
MDHRKIIELMIVEFLTNIYMKVGHKREDVDWFNTLTNAWLWIWRHVLLEPSTSI